MRLRSYIVVGISLTVGLGNPGPRGGRQVTPPISAISVQYSLPDICVSVYENRKSDQMICLALPYDI